MPNRVELARPFAVVDAKGSAFARDTAEAALACIEAFDRDWPADAPHIVVRLTAERVEEPITEATSGWEWRVRVGQHAKVLERRCGDAWDAMYYFPCADDWRRCVPPCDHAHVAELLRREGVA